MAHPVRAPPLARPVAPPLARARIRLLLLIHTSPKAAAVRCKNLGAKYLEPRLGLGQDLDVATKPLFRAN